MTEELQEIDGVGPAFADRLTEWGYESAEDVADADPDRIEEAVETGDGDEIVESAHDLLSDEEGDSEDVDDVDVDEGDNTVPFDEPRVVVYHTIAGLADRDLEARKNPNRENLPTAHDATEKVIRAYSEGRDEIQLTDDELKELYLAVHGLQQEYRGDISRKDLYSQMRSFRDEVNDVRLG